MKSSNQNGFGLLEVMVAFIVLGFMIVSINQIQRTSRWQLVYNENRTMALQKAQRIFDSLQVAGINSLDEGTTPWVCNEPGAKKNYDCEIIVANLGVAGTVDEADEYVYSKNVNVKVMWKISGGDHHVQMDGVIE